MTHNIIVAAVIMAIAGLILIVVWCISLLINSGSVSKDDVKYVNDIDGKKNYPKRSMK